MNLQWDQHLNQSFGSIFYISSVGSILKSILWIMNINLVYEQARMNFNLFLQWIPLAAAAPSKYPVPEANYDDDDDVDHDDGDNIWLHEYRTLLAQVGSSPALSRSGSTSSLASSLSCAPVQEVPPTAPAIILLIIPIITNNHNYASIILIIMRIIIRILTLRIKITTQRQVRTLTTNFQRLLAQATKEIKKLTSEKVTIIRLSN